MRSSRDVGAVLAAVLLLLALQGCGAMTASGRAWGRDATAAPGWERVRAAAGEALKSPAVWLPAAGALGLQVDDYDGRIAHHAAEHTPLYGSRGRAADASDALVALSAGVFALSVLAVPGGDTPHDRAVNKSRGLAVEAAAIGATLLSADGLKQATRRERPDASGDDSFPSAHAASAAVLTRLTMLNLAATDLSPSAHRGTDAALATLTLATGWARVEAQKHYPADALAGMALGNFLALFCYHAFLAQDEIPAIQPTAELGHGRYAIGVRMIF